MINIAKWSSVAGHTVCMLCLSFPLFLFSMRWKMRKKKYLYTWVLIFNTKYVVFYLVHIFFFRWQYGTYDENVGRCYIWCRSSINSVNTREWNIKLTNTWNLSTNNNIITMSSKTFVFYLSFSHSFAHSFAGPLTCTSNMGTNKYKTQNQHPADGFIGFLLSNRAYYSCFIRYLHNVP